MLHQLLLDRRDEPLLNRLVLSFFLVFPCALGMLFSEFTLLKAVLYLSLVVIPQMAPYSCYIHTVIHSGIFKKKYKIINHLHYWTVGIFLGETPYTHYTHHIGMHHPENNNTGDLSSTLMYQRDSIRDFMRYYWKFAFLGSVILPYFKRKRRIRFFKLTALGEASFVIITAACLYLNPLQAVIVFLLPLFIMRSGMACINWSQHAFLDVGQLNNNYRICTTIIDSSYNKNCFNDAYHIEHHSYPREHWSSLPYIFEKNKTEYIKNRSVVFRSIGYLQLFILLMLRQYKVMAKYFVDLSGAMSQAEIIQLLRERTIKHG